MTTTEEVIQIGVTLGYWEKTDNLCMVQTENGVFSIYSKGHMLTVQLGIYNDENGIRTYASDVNCDLSAGSSTKQSAEKIATSFYKRVVNNPEGIAAAKAIRQLQQDRQKMREDLQKQVDYFVTLGYRIPQSHDNKLPLYRYESTKMFGGNPIYEITVYSTSTVYIHTNFSVGREQFLKILEVLK